MIRQETRRWDEGSGKTVLMRVKTDAVDYKYFCEPNITPIILSEEFVSNAIETCPELYDSKKERYLSLGLSNSDAEIILANPFVASYFEKAALSAKNPKVLANFIIGELNAYLNKEEMNIEELSLEPSVLAEVTNMQEEGLSHKQCVDILNKVLKDNVSPAKAKEMLNISVQVSDSGTILSFVTLVLDKNPQSISDFKSGNQRVLGFLVGQVMKESHGRINPAEASKILKEEIDKR